MCCPYDELYKGFPMDRLKADTCRSRGSLCAGTVELDEELCLETPACLVLVRATHAQHAVHFVDKDYRRLRRITITK